MPTLGTSIRRRFLVGGAITCLLLGILPGSAIARSGPSPAKHATDSGLTPIVLFPAWHFTRLTVTVKHQKTDPACPAPGRSRISWASSTLVRRSRRSAATSC